MTYRNCRWARGEAPPSWTARSHTAARAPLLATPIMVAVMEAAAVDCIERALPAGHESLGVRIDVEHVTDPRRHEHYGDRGALRAERTHALVSPFDEVGVIGKGRHMRVVVDSERFRAKVRAKRAPGR